MTNFQENLFNPKTFGGYKITANGLDTITVEDYPNGKLIYQRRVSGWCVIVDVTVISRSNPELQTALVRNLVPDKHSTCVQDFWSAMLETANETKRAEQDALQQAVMSTINTCSGK